MVNAGLRQGGRFLAIVAALLLVLCAAMSGLLIAFNQSLFDSIFIIVVMMVFGGVYAWLAVRAQLRAERTEDANRLH